MKHEKPQTGAEKIINYGSTVITWRAPEFRELDRGSNWFMTAGIIAVMLVAWAIWQNAYPFAIVVILISGIYFLTHKDRPKEIDIALTSNGILADNKFYSFPEVENFWVIFKPEIDIKTLTITLKTGVIREVTFQLGSQDPAEIRSFLSAHVYELQDRTENFVEKVIRVLKL